MIAKTFEIRDVMTFIPALAIKLKPECEADRYLLGRAGFGAASLRQAKPGYVLLMRLTDNGIALGHWEWSRAPRTMQVAHHYITDHFDQLASGAVIDVEYILGERVAPKASESLTGGLANGT